MNDQHLIVTRVGDEYFRDADRPRPFQENIARWNILDVALRNDRLVRVDPRATGPYRAHSATAVAARWVAQRSPGDNIPGAGAVERLPSILLRALGSGESSPNADAIVALWGRAHGFMDDGEGRVREVRPDGSLSPTVAASWADLAARIMPDGTLLLVDGVYHLADPGSVPAR